MSLWGNQDLKTGSGTGTVVVTAANSTVVAAGGADLSVFAVGDFLNVGGNDYVFTAIANASVATVRSGINGGALVGASANAAYVVSEKPLYVVYSEANGDAGAVFGVDTGEMAYANTAGTEADAVPHAGWVRRTEGTGGRSGRVSYEVLVAGSSITGDAADDTQLPE